MNSFKMKATTNDQGIMFFKNLKKKLKGTSTRKVVSIVRIVLNKLKGSLSPQQLGEALTHKSSFIQLLFGSDQFSQVKRINHLDELVELLMAEDQRLGTRLFKSEIETLSIVILILRQIQISFEKLGLNVLPHTMERELQGALIDEAIF